MVGGGSTYTPELVDGLARLGDVLDVSELVLLDPDAPRLEVVGGFAQRILDERGATTKLVLTSDLEAAVDGASAVLLQLRVGGQAARAGRLLADAVAGERDRLVTGACRLPTDPQL